MVRLATEADIPAMHAVRIAVQENRLSRPDRIAPADYAAAIGPLGRGWIAEAGGVVVGFAVGYASGNIWALFVHPAHEGRGYGKALHAAMVSWLWQTGLRRLWLTTEPGTRAETFYRSLGWRACGMVPGGELRFELDRPHTSGASISAPPPSPESPVAVVAFAPRHAAAFRDLNTAWIEEHWELEPKDIAALSDPQRAIVDMGGKILIAEDAGTAVGCVALIPHGDNGTLELAKMAVAAGYRGRGVGRLLMAMAIAHARSAGATRLYLESNSRLAPAIRLYEAAGFRRLEGSSRSPYARCNIAMELDLRAGR